MIPALIVPILNQPELLAKMLDSIGDHPVERLIVIDNGGVIPDDGSEVIRLPHNIGVAASWNLGIKCAPRAPWWLIVNHDIEFGPGDLGRLEEAVDPRAAGIWMMLGLAAFAITRHTLNAVGWFDEGVGHPAYNEDIDYMRRIDLAGLPRHEVGFTGKHVGSATIMADPTLRMINGVTHSGNDRRYAEKWGGAKQGGETYSTPFNRGGHLGDWRLDIELLRDHAWPRRTQE
jgi:glycosyltransferase involved in cell wall biosynthesis